MAQVIYTLCALTAFACTWLLLRAYRQTQLRLLFWSGLCFMALTANNILLVLDKMVFSEVDLLPWRLATGLAAVILLLFGLIYEER